MLVAALVLCALFSHTLASDLSGTQLLALREVLASLGAPLCGIVRFLTLR